MMVLLRLVWVGLVLVVCGCASGGVSRVPAGAAHGWVEFYCKGRSSAGDLAVDVCEVNAAGGAGRLVGSTFKAVRLRVACALGSNEFVVALGPAVRRVPVVVVEGLTTPVCVDSSDTMELVVGNGHNRLLLLLRCYVGSPTDGAGLKVLFDVEPQYKRNQLPVGAVEVGGAG